MDFVIDLDYWYSVVLESVGPWREKLSGSRAYFSLVLDFQSIHFACYIHFIHLISGRIYDTHIRTRPYRIASLAPLSSNSDIKGKK